MPSLALACRLSAVSRASRRPFSPASLFSSGEQGVWYDPSDLTTLFGDSAGTTPITTPLEKPVGLMLDKSKGLGLGPELVTNGTFGTDISGWTPSGGSASAVNGELVLTSNSGGTTYPFVTQKLSTPTGKWYKIVVTSRNQSMGSGTAFQFGSTSGTASIFNSGLSTATQNTERAYYWYSTNASPWITVYGQASASGQVCYFDNISVRELPGNHAYQSTSTSRPTLSARYNLLTKTEQFDDAAWMKSDVTVLPNTTVAPNGTTTADKLIENNASNYHYLVQNTTAPTGGVFSIYAKAGERFQFGIYLDGARVGAGFDLSSGSKITLPEYSAGSPTSSITSVGNGWYRITINAASSVSNIQIGIGKDGASSYTSDGTSGIYIWGADLRVANDGVNLPSYQRVNTGTDYDYAGFPPYLKFDGTDDSMVTNSIDFSATDKMSVFAGVRKLSNSGTGTITEFSPSIDNNYGGFGVWAPNNTDNSYSMYSKGTAITGSMGVTAFTAPISNVFTGEASISGPFVRARVNGTQTFNVTNSQGSGNYGNYPLFIGRRGGTSYPFSGRIYSLIVCGKQLSASEITSMENWVNGKVKAY